MLIRSVYVWYRDLVVSLALECTKPWFSDCMETHGTHSDDFCNSISGLCPGSY